MLSQCLICCRHDRPSFQLPCMPPWPRERVSQSHLFQFVGLRYLRTVYVKVHSRASFRGWGPLSHFLDEGLHSDLHKIWICLFTCLSVRAMHLEWVMNLTATQFLNYLRRFVSQRGKLDSIIFDNASQFKLTNMAL